MAIVYKGRRRKFVESEHPRNPSTGEFVEKTGGMSWLQRLAGRVGGKGTPTGITPASGGGGLRPTVGNTKAANLLAGSHARVQGVDSSGRSMKLDGYVQGVGPVTMRQGGKRTPMLAVQMAETPSGGGANWRSTVYVPRDATVQRTKPKDGDLSRKPIGEPRSIATIDMEIERITGQMNMLGTSPGDTTRRMELQGELNRLRKWRVAHTPGLAQSLADRVGRQLGDDKPNLHKIMQDAGITTRMPERSGGYAIDQARARLKRGDSPAEVAEYLREQALSLAARRRDMPDDMSDSPEANGLRVAERILGETSMAVAKLDTPRAKQDDGGMAPTSELENIGPSYAYERRAELVGRTVTVYKPGRNGGKSVPVTGKVASIERMPGAQAERIYLEGRKTPIPLEAGIDLHPAKNVAPAPAGTMRIGNRDLTADQIIALAKDKPAQFLADYAKGKYPNVRTGSDKLTRDNLETAAARIKDGTWTPEQAATQLEQWGKLQTTLGRTPYMFAATALRGNLRPKASAPSAPSAPPAPEPKKSSLASLTPSSRITLAEMPKHVRPAFSAARKRNYIEAARQSNVMTRDDFEALPESLRTELLDALGFAAAAGDPDGISARDRLTGATISRVGTGGASVSRDSNALATLMGVKPKVRGSVENAVNVLKTTNDRDEARRALDGLTVAQLKQVFTGVDRNAPSGRKADLIDKLVQTTVESRLTGQVLRGEGPGSWMETLSTRMVKTDASVNDVAAKATFTPLRDPDRNSKEGFALSLRQMPGAGLHGTAAELEAGDITFDEAASRVSAFARSLAGRTMSEVNQASLADIEARLRKAGRADLGLDRPAPVPAPSAYAPMKRASLLAILRQRGLKAKRGAPDDDLRKLLADDDLQGKEGRSKALASSAPKTHMVWQPPGEAPVVGTVIRQNSTSYYVQWSGPGTTDRVERIPKREAGNRDRYLTPMSDAEFDAAARDEGLVGDAVRDLANKPVSPRESVADAQTVESLASLKRPALLAVARQHGVKLRRGAPEKEIAEAIVAKQREQFAGERADREGMRDVVLNDPLRRLPGAPTPANSVVAHSIRNEHIGATVRFTVPDRFGRVDGDKTYEGVLLDTRSVDSDQMAVRIAGTSGSVWLPKTANIEIVSPRPDTPEHQRYAKALEDYYSAERAATAAKYANTRPTQSNDEVNARGRASAANDKLRAAQDALLAKLAPAATPAPAAARVTPDTTKLDAQIAKLETKRETKRGQLGMAADKRRGRIASQRETKLRGELNDIDRDLSNLKLERRKVVAAHGVDVLGIKLDPAVRERMVRSRLVDIERYRRETPFPESDEQARRAIANGTQPLAAVNAAIEVASAGGRSHLNEEAAWKADIRRMLGLPETDVQPGDRAVEVPPTGVKFGDVISDRGLGFQVATIVRNDDGSIFLAGPGMTTTSTRTIKPGEADTVKVWRPGVSDKGRAPLLDEESDLSMMARRMLQQFEDPEDRRAAANRLRVSQGLPEKGAPGKAEAAPVAAPAGPSDAELLQIVRDAGFDPTEGTIEQWRDWLRRRDATLGPQSRPVAANDATPLVKSLRAQLRALELDREVEGLNGPRQYDQEEEAQRAAKAKRDELKQLRDALTEAERAERGMGKSRSTTYRGLSDVALDRHIKAAKPGTKKLQALLDERDARAAERFRSRTGKA